MGCWGITAFESDAGLDAVDFIRKNLPENGQLELGTIIEAIQRENCRLPDVQDAESHTSPMALAEIVAKFLDGDVHSLDYNDEWAAKDNKFSAITSFTASKESLLWLRNYVSDTLKFAKQNAELGEQYGRKWGGWFKEQDWIGWQEHMKSLVSRLNTLLTSPERVVELIPTQEQETRLITGQGEKQTDCPATGINGQSMEL